MTEPCDLSATEARRLIGCKRLSPIELVDSCIARIEMVNPTVNAVVAATALKLILTGIALKDIIATRTGNPIITITTEQVVRSTAAYQRIVAIAAVDSTESIGAAELMTDRRRIVIRARQ